jgi:4-amino-4-deoxy-L-arabinose transferase-like glycosyltransferase
MRRVRLILLAAGLALAGVLLTRAPVAVKLGFPAFMVALALFAWWSTKRIVSGLRSRNNNADEPLGS